MRAARLFPVLILAAFGCGGTPTAPDLGFVVQAVGSVPTTAVIGTTITLTAKVLHKESGGATTPAAGKVLTLTVTAGGGTINGATTTTVTTAADGTATGSWQLGPVVGPQTLRGSVSATEFLDFTLAATAPPATQLVVATAPSGSAQSGAPLAQQPAIQLKDAGGNNTPQAGVQVTATIESGGGTLSGTTTVATNASGLAAFTNLAISGTIGNRTLKFTATLSGAPASVTSGTIALAAGAAAQLAVVTQPSGNAQSGAPLAQQPTVQLKDASGNNAAQAGVQVTATIESGGGTLAGTATVATNANGLATFTDLAISGTTGNRTLKFTASLGGSAVAVTSSPIVLVPPSASQLALATQPSGSAQSGAPLAQQPAVQLKDGGGNNVAQAGVQITVTIESGGGTLAGTTTVATNASGLAAFTDLAINGLIGNRTLKFTATLSGTPASVTSGAIALAAGAAVQLVLKTQPPATTPVGFKLLAQPSLQVQDAAGNPVPQAGVVVTASLSSGSALRAGSGLASVLSGGLTASTDAAGTATFTDLMLYGSLGSKTLGFSATVGGQLRTVNSSPVSVTLPANGKLVFKSNDDEIWVANPDGSGATQLTQGYGASGCQSGDEEPQWSPDGSKIVFTRTQNGAQEVWVMNADGSGQTQLTTGGSADCAGDNFSENPSWSPDGKKILFTSDRTSGGFLEELWIMNADGTGQTRLFTRLPTQGVSEAFFSPDGQTIAFQLATLNQAGTACGDPPGTGNNEEGNEIWLINADGINPRRVTTLAGCTYDENLSWAPDGQRIVFTAGNSPSAACVDEVAIININGTNRTLLTNCILGRTSEHPAFSPDGTKVVFANGFGDSIWIMNPDGTGAAAITLGGLADNGQPAWQPVRP